MASNGPNSGDNATLKPIEYNPNTGVNGGHYRISSMSGLMAAGIASAAQVFQIRWVSGSRFFVLKQLTIQCSTCTGFAATTVGAPLELIIGHGSTANGSGGGALAPTSVGNKMRSTMGTTEFAAGGEIRIATTAALTAATGQTLEPAPIGSCMGADNRTLVTTAPFDLFKEDATDHPLMLNSGDSLVIRTNVPAATGTWFFTVQMAWVETTGF